MRLRPTTAAAVLLSAFSGVLFSGATGARGQEVSPASPAAEASSGEWIEVQTLSWGRLVSAWRIAPDGSGWLKTTRPGKNGFNDYVVLVQRLDPVAGRYQQVERALRQPRTFVDRKLPCRVEYTDGPYGSVTWRSQGKVKQLSVQYACISNQANAVYAHITKASDLIRTWTAGSPAAEEPPPGS